MASDFIDKSTELIKLVISPIQRHFWGLVTFVTVLGWLILFLPGWIIVAFHIDGLRSMYLEVIGAVTGISTLVMFFWPIRKVYFFFEQKWSEAGKIREREQLLHNLTRTEYQRLREFIVGKSQTATFTLYDGVVAGLVDKGILYKPNSLANKGGEQDFNLHPWAFDYFAAHPELFALDGGSHNETEVRQAQE